MIVCKLYIKDIDYNSVVERLMPIITKELSDTDNIFCSIIKKIISKNNKPSAITKLMVSIAPNKDELAVSLLHQYSEDILLYANEALKKLMISANVKSIKARAIQRAGSRLIRLEIAVDNIDYEQTIVNQIPFILKKFSRQSLIACKTGSILTKNFELIESMTRAAIKEIPEEKRDKLLAGFLSEFDKEIKEAIGHIIFKNNIKAEIWDIAIQNIVIG